MTRRMSSRVLRRRTAFRGLLAGCVAACAASFVALPAHAAAPNGAITQPAADGGTFTSEPASFSGYFSYPVQNQAGVIDEIRLAVSSPDNHPVPAPADFTYGNPQPNQQFTWVAGPFTYNGTYTLVATGTGHDTPPDGSGRQTTTVSRSFVVSIPPNTPSGLSAESDSGNRTIKLSWTPNTEPDIYAYAVLRKNPSAKTYGWVGGTRSTSFTDTNVASQPAGSYGYEIVAYRQPGDGSSNYLPSQPSPPAYASVSGTPVTTTTTSPPPSGKAAGAGSGNPLAPVPPGGKLAPPPPLPAAPRADAGDFGALLAQARASSTNTTEPDTYNPRLPFGPRSTSEVVNVPGSPNALASGAQLGADDGAQRRRLTFEYVAGGLLLFVLAMHALYLRRQLDQVLPLEAVEPGPPVAGEA